MATTQENPLLEGLQLRRSPDPCALVIFGASGDLTQKKLFPALYSLAFRRLLPQQFAVVGVARTEETDEEFKARMKEAVQQHSRDEFREDVWESLADGMRYIPTDFADEHGQSELDRMLAELDDERGLKGNRVFYLAIPPSVFPTVVSALGRHRSSREGWTRLIVEKPFGHDLDSAQKLTALIHEHFTEDEVFRIDHYLGKETVQNMLALRFANGIFEPIWNRQFVDHVQITVAESIGIESHVAAKLYVDNWRWADTPFYVRMGKRLARRETTIAIEFKRAPHPPFEETAEEALRPNVLIVHIQPDEGVSLAIGAKVPGQG